MNKKIVGIIISLSLVATPFVSFAQTINTSNTYTSALQQLIALLTQELMQLETQLAQQQSQNTISPQATTTVTEQSANDSWASYPKTMFNSFANAPASYLGQSIEIKGEVNEFLPAGGNGGSHNYIATMDPNAYTTEPVMLEINNSVDYLAAVNTVRNLDLVAAYGTAIGSTMFTYNGQQISVPVLDITRLDDVGGCDSFGCLVSSDTVIFPAGAMPLTTPQNSMSSALPSSQ